MAESVNSAMGKTCVIGQAVDNAVDGAEIAVGGTVNRADNVVVLWRTVAHHTLIFFLLGFFLYQSSNYFFSKRNFTGAALCLGLGNELRDAGSSTCTALVDAEQTMIK